MSSLALRLRSGQTLRLRSGQDLLLRHTAVRETARVEPTRLLNRNFVLLSQAQLVSQFGNCVPVVIVNGKVRFRGHINQVLLTRILHA